MELLIKCVSLTLICAVSATVIKRYLPEISVILVLLACATIFGSVSGVFTGVADFVREIASVAGIAPEVLQPIFKVCAIAMLVRICGDICKQSGVHALASAVELCGSIIAVMLSLPLLRSVMQLITRM